MRLEELRMRVREKTVHEEYGRALESRLVELSSSFSLTLILDSILVFDHIREEFM